MFSCLLRRIPVRPGSLLCPSSEMCCTLRWHSGESVLKEEKHSFKVGSTKPINIFWKLGYDFYIYMLYENNIHRMSLLKTVND